MGTLQYDSKTRQFWFWASNMKPVEGYTHRHTGLGDMYVFKDEMPWNILGLKSFGVMNPGSKATKEAMARIAEIKREQAALDDPQIATQFNNLFKRTPYVHQARAIEYMMHYPKLLMVLEQGLGKTFITYMSVRLWKELGIPHKTLVVCPRIVLANWLREVERYTDMRILPYYGSPEERAACRERLQNEAWDMVVTTFDMLVQRQGASLYVYETLWIGMSDELRKKYSCKWFNGGLIDKAQLDTLLSSASVKKNQAEVSRILRDIPASKMPINLLNQVKRDADNVELLYSLPWDNLVVDEASRCLNVKSQRSHAVERMASKAKRIYMLSGTLCVGRPTDMYMPARILDPEIIPMNWMMFKNEFCVFRDPQRHIIVRYKNLEKLKMMVDPHMLSMVRSDCIDMPDRIFVPRYYELSDAQKDLYNSIATTNWISTGWNEGIACELVLQKLTKCMQVLSGFVKTQCNCKAVCGECEHIVYCLNNDINPGTDRCQNDSANWLDDYRIIELDNGKLELLSDDLDDLLEDEQQKVIIWAWYRYDLETIAKLLRKKKIDFVTADERDCDAKFNDQSKIRVFLGQTRQGIGITLNSATVTIYYSHGPDLEARLQSMDRNYRIGQKNSVIVHDYVCHGSVEETMLALLDHKEDVKNFMQTGMDCLVCERRLDCKDIGRAADCNYAKQLAKTEAKRMLRIPII